MTQSPLKVIALISGGKDSLFSILHCIENGHEVVALANLHPKLPSNGRTDDAEGEDMNSFMYQTVGHSIIPLYSDCLGIPLYRREITGSAVQTGRYYDTSGEQKSFDETEDLVLLLHDVLRKHPEANALCSGAILSTYQRARVDSVAVRLGLIPLAYLWQYPALPPPPGRQDSLTGLLEDMSAAGCDARIIKIASGGIKENLLWSNVSEANTRSRLVSGLRPFFTEHEFWLRGAVLGEGGEYETLAVDGPRPLWKRRIDLPTDTSSTFYGEGGVSYLRLGKAKTVENDPDSSHEISTALQPRPLDVQFEAVLERVQTQASEMTSTRDSEATTVLSDNHSARFSIELLPLTRKLSLAYLTISNITATTTGVPSEDKGTAADQMRRICEKLKSVLDSLSSTQKVPGKLTTSNIVATTLLLKDMSQFASVNSTYSSMFRSGEPNPPARVTISCQLPQDVEVSLNVILDLGPRDARRGLHVQSRSYWAPANIGPYSQAICVPLQQTSEMSVNVHDAGLLEMVHVAGQIPLVPQSMLLDDGGFTHASVLSLQHLWRVGQEREVDIWPWGIAFLKRDPDAAHRNATTAQRIWEHAHRIGTRSSNSSARDDDDIDDEDDQGPDAWDLRFNRFQLANSAAENAAIGQHLHVLPNNTVFGKRATTADVVPPFIAAEVTSLPRDAPVEWWSLGVANLIKTLTSSSTAAAAATCGREDFEWGSISRTSLHAESPKQSSGGHPSTVRQHLVTVLIRSASGGSGKPRHGPRQVDDDVRAHLLRTIGDDVHVGPRPKLPPVLECVHGTAFLSTVEGRPRWAEVSKGELFNSLTVIPCTSVHGRGQVGTLSGGLIDDASPFPGGVKSGESLGPVGETGTSVTDVTAVSETCQPLAVAMTMRIDSTWSR
ncbi:uncharacterized protein PV06_10793 [Exophiala oligosperma]|uniref:Diphthine--ammonia ligase n=1 Tax=Exophiala oligosperma TaxID=215243 RepID=A0A0D2DN34_9EURO|nr:uncharacterized protein PV06_10793 [Exophiala oligosperma]KIW37174.1 hypothetical protein PV06_10793 [Exophiala oligosperma]